jgi:hypothetical protein
VELFGMAPVAAMHALCTAEGSMSQAFAILPAATGIGPNKRMEVGRPPTKVAADPHSARLALDHVEWFDRLARLAELRESGQ